MLKFLNHKLYRWETFHSKYLLSAYNLVSLFLLMTKMSSLLRPSGEGDGFNINAISDLNYNIQQLLKQCDMWGKNQTLRVIKTFLAQTWLFFGFSGRVGNVIVWFIGFNDDDIIARIFSNVNSNFGIRYTTAVVVYLDDVIIVVDTYNVSVAAGWRRDTAISCRGLLKTRAKFSCLSWHLGIAHS